MKSKDDGEISIEYFRITFPEGGQERPNIEKHECTKRDCLKLKAAEESPRSAHGPAEVACLGNLDRMSLQDETEHAQPIFTCRRCQC